MSRLAELLPFNAGETLASYCSRLAAACGYRHARSFGTDLGFRFQGLAVGDELDVNTFASVLGVSRPSLSPGVVITGDLMTILAGQRLTRAYVQRNRLRFCPHCIRDDELYLDGRRGFRGYGRLEWLVSPIRACRQHGVRLVTSAIKPESRLHHDFAANLAAESLGAGTIEATTDPMEPDLLQEYVESRIRNNGTRPQWLESFPLYAVVKLSETIGASERHGIHFHARSLDEQEWSTCAGAGYRILRGGELDFRDYLKNQLKPFLTAKGDMGGRVVFGRLYERLAHETSDEAYDPIRDIMRDVALNNLPLGPGDDFFGPITERRIHSLHTASKEFGIHEKTLGKLLTNAGLVPSPRDDNSLERILIDAEGMKKFAADVAGGLGGAEARAHLGAHRVQFDLLLKHRFIEPHDGDRTETQLPVLRRFRSEDLDNFLARLRSAVTCADDEGLSDISTAMKKAVCSFATVVNLLLDRKLQKVALAENFHGIAAVRVDALEVKEKTRTEDHGCFSLRFVASQIPAREHVVKSLIEGGRLEAVRRRNWATRAIQLFVEPDVLFAFKREFVSLGNLATQLRRRSSNIRRDLENLEVKPAFIAAGMPFYRRSEIFPVL